MICFGGEEQTSVWRTVVAGKVCEFAIEVLKTESDAEPCLIFFEKRPRVSNILIGFGWKDVHRVFKQKQETRLLPSPVTNFMCRGYAVNEEPQPQLPVAFGFLNVNPDPITPLT